ncbi:MAG: CHAT domain-containing protein/Tfp pilus assembly protein PilF [Myxococcota bacterium]|jgi:CHAT domain-containing protein/Tfp pilus assembly protein PilF
MTLLLTSLLLLASPPIGTPVEVDRAIRALSEAISAGDPASVEAAALSAKEVVDRHPPSRARADVYFQLAVIRSRSADPAGSEAHLLTSRAAYIAVLGTGDDNVAAVDGALVNLLTGWGRALYRRGKYREAVDVFERAIGRAPDPRLAGLYNEQASALTFAGDPARAVKRLKQALKLEDGPAIRSGLALAYKRLGKLPEARGQYEKALAAMLKANSPDDFNVGILSDNLGNLLAMMGDYAAARSRFREAERIFIAADAKRSIAVNLVNQGALAKQLGDASGAERLFRRAVKANSEVLGPDHPQVGLAHSNLGSTLGDLGRWKEAIASYQLALRVLESGLGAEHEEVAKLLNNLGWTFERDGRAAEAIPLYERALAIQKKVPGASHPTTAATLANLGAALWRTGDVKRGERLTRQSLKIMRRRLGDRHAWVAERYATLARIEHKRGNAGKALKLAHKALDIARSVVDGLQWATSERERIEAVDAQRDKVALVLTLGDEPLASWEAGLWWKGAALSTLTAQRQRVVDAGDVGALKTLAQLRRVRSRLAELVVAVDADAAAVQAVQTQKETLEQRLSQQSRRYASVRTQQSAGAAEVCASLKSGESLVDFVRYRHQDADRYVAFVVDKTCTPARVDLGAAALLDRAISTFREAIEESPDDGESLVDLLRVVRALAWDPLRPYLAGNRRIFLAPDSALNGVPFAALPLGTEPDRYLIHRYTFSTIAGARELLRPGRSGAGGTLVVGGVDYEGGADPEVAVAAVLGRTSRGASCRAGSAAAWSPLPASVTEGEAVAATQPKAGLVHLEGAHATEGAVIRAMESSRVIHLATHGFFAGECADRYKTLSPLVMSGVVLSGANGAHGPGQHDGILTAEEVAGLDLSKVDLAVLSACETGLGDVRTGAGVLGLRWAFAVAGARALVMSLWKVPDEETRRLMTSFYAEMGPQASPADSAAAVIGSDKAVTFRKAQLALIARAREQGDTNPWLWGAFLISGR